MEERPQRGLPAAQWRRSWVLGLWHVGTWNSGAVGRLRPIGCLLNIFQFLSVAMVRLRVGSCNVLKIILTELRFIWEFLVYAFEL